MENDLVAKKARLIWSKYFEVVSYWQQLPKNKQPGLGKPGANTTYAVTYSGRLVDRYTSLGAQKTLFRFSFFSFISTYSIFK